MKITETKREKYVDIRLQNEAGMVLTLCTLGAALHEIRVPDKTGKSRIVTMIPADEENFRAKYYGKTIGRTAGRIAGATFTVGGKTAVLEKNNRGEDNLHGGSTGLHAQVFGYSVHPSEKYTDVVFTYFSPDGEGGYFGNVNFAVTYRVQEKENSILMLYDATTDEPTLVNLTNHVYLNLGGEMSERVTEQTLTIAASRMAKLNDRLIVEDIVPVTEATDFTKPRKIGEKIYDPSVQTPTNGYDHVYFLDAPGMDTQACELVSQQSGIALTMRTTSPCVVFYSNSMPKTDMKMSPADRNDEKYIAACLECERFSDGIRDFPHTCPITTPESPYHEETEYKFTVRK